jgi:hypothetical protein
MISLYLLLLYLDRPSGKPNEKRRRKPGSNERIGSSSTGNASYMVSKFGRGYRNSMGINQKRNPHARRSTTRTTMKKEVLL